MGNIFPKKSTSKKTTTHEIITEPTTNCVMTCEGDTIIGKQSNTKPVFIPNKTKTPSPSKKSTDDVLDDIVERYMKNELINNPAIPDWIERRLYKNVLKLAIGVASDTLNNTNFEVLGHEVNVSIKPKQD